MQIQRIQFTIMELTVFLVTIVNIDVKNKMTSSLVICENQVISIQIYIQKMTRQLAMPIAD